MNMTTFQLSNDFETFILNLKGEVLDNDQKVIGQWTTNETNQIVIKLSGTDVQSIDVVWQFDKNNHLCLLSQEEFFFEEEEMEHDSGFDDSDSIEVFDDDIDDLGGNMDTSNMEEGTMDEGTIGEDEGMGDDIEEIVGDNASDGIVENVEEDDQSLGQAIGDETTASHAAADIAVLNNRKIIVNFSLLEKERPRYTCDKAKLMVTPDVRNRNFSFPLFGEWDLNEEHLLIWTVNGVTSVLDGVLQDNRSRFVYRFRDKMDLRRRSRLIFMGSWEQEMRTDADGDSFPSLNFHYICHDNTQRTFSLPGALVIDKSLNQFAYTYDKDNESVGITLMGFFEISENFEITYTIDKQVSTLGEEEVASTKFGLIAAVSNDKVEGELELQLLKDNNEPSNYKLLLAGEYFCEHDDSSLMIGFRFLQQKEDGVVTTAVGLHGRLLFEEGEVFYVLDMDPFEKTLKLETGVQVQLENGVGVDQKLLVKGTDGQVKKVTFLLGIRF